MSRAGMFTLTTPDLAKGLLTFNKEPVRYGEEVPPPGQQRGPGQGVGGHQRGIQGLVLGLGVVHHGHLLLAVRTTRCPMPRDGKTGSGRRG